MASVRCAVLPNVVPEPMRCASSTATVLPASRSLSAAVRPVMPPPMTTASICRSSSSGGNVWFGGETSHTDSERAEAIAPQTVQRAYPLARCPKERLSVRRHVARVELHRAGRHQEVNAAALVRSRHSGVAQGYPTGDVPPRRAGGELLRRAVVGGEGDAHVRHAGGRSPYAGEAARPARRV